VSLCGLQMNVRMIQTAEWTVIAWTSPTSRTRRNSASAIRDTSDRSATKVGELQRTYRFPNLFEYANHKYMLNISFYLLYVKYSRPTCCLVRKICRHWFWYSRRRMFSLYKSKSVDTVCSFYGEIPDFRSCALQQKAPFGDSDALLPHRSGRI